MKQLLCCTAMFTAVALTTIQSRGDVVIDVFESGGDVVFDGSGSIDLAGLDFSLDADLQAQVTEDFFLAGPAVPVSADTYSGVTGPGGIGPVVFTFASSGFGDIFGVDYIPGAIALPGGYVSGDDLSFTSTYDGQSVDSLGIATGTYVWNVGSASTVTLNVIPEPSGMVLVSLGAIGSLFIRRRSGQV